MTEHVIGYKRPPKSTQFKPGQSGNPKGRPRQKKQSALQTIEEMFVSIMNEIVEVAEDGRRKRINKMELLLRSVLAQGFKGHNASMKILFALLAEHFSREKCEARIDEAESGGPMSLEEARKVFLKARELCRHSD
jgi:hypothetical protein